MTASKQTTDGVDYTNTYTYNLSGALIEQTYPSGQVVKNVLDESGDLATVQSKRASGHAFWNYANRFEYNAAGAVTSMQLGNGTWESTTFNSRLQPLQIALGKTENATDLLELDYTYGTNDNNGNVMSQTITVPGVAHHFIQSYSYDSLNRLDDASETYNSSQTWRQDFTFNRYGNRRFNESNTTMPTSFTNQAETNPTISTSNNRLTSSGWDYDLSGNTTEDPQGREYTYDAENKQVKVTDGSDTIGEYWYDGDGKRVRKHVPDTGEVTVFVYDAGGKLVMEYSTIVETDEAKVGYLTNDHLGSPRINTGVNGHVTSRHDYHPFGEEIVTSQRTSGLGYIDDTVRKQFTGHERDLETELDFAQARFYSSRIGRFLSTDPIFVSNLRLVNPQVWNSYSYVSNNPLGFIDPNGMERIQLGQSEAEIKKDLEKARARKKELEDQKKALNRDKKSLSKEEVKARQATIRNESSKAEAAIQRLNVKLEGTQMVNAMLEVLRSKGEDQGLQLEDFSLTTDPTSDFPDTPFPEGVSNTNAFVTHSNNQPANGGQIFINTRGPLFDGARNGRDGGTSGDWIAWGASWLRHERWHRSAPTHAERMSERLAYREQLPVLRRLEPAFNTPSFYRNRVRTVMQGGQRPR